MSVYDKLAEIQSTLKAPKSQYNSFGKYNFRSCEDILEAVKPLLKGATITLSDDIIMVGDRVYVKATATLRLGDDFVSVSSNAREAIAKKGMDDSQITGTASSYARKYALNGLLLIDDTKDADSFSPEKKHTKQDQGWIDAIKSGRSKLEDINDPAYRETIKGYLK